MIRRLYDKSKIWFAVLWIIAYCVLMSAGDSLSETIGVAKIITLPIACVLSFLLLMFFRKNVLWKQYGLCRAECPAKKMLYYIPVLIMMTTNLWLGVHFSLSAGETVLYTLTMFCVGFLEEIIFRGLLFKAMRENSTKAAIIVSSVTFGIGHIINLFNGSGAELISNLLQVVYATAAGFMFVMIYFRTHSLWICIGAHGLFNALSVFSNEVVQTTQTRIITCVLLTLITGGYAVYIALSVKREAKQKRNEIVGDIR